MLPECRLCRQSGSAQRYSSSGPRSLSASAAYTNARTRAKNEPTGRVAMWAGTHSRCVDSWSPCASRKGLGRSPAPHRRHSRKPLRPAASTKSATAPWEAVLSCVWCISGSRFFSEFFVELPLSGRWRMREIGRPAQVARRIRVSGQRRPGARPPSAVGCCGYYCRPMVLLELVHPTLSCQRRRRPRLRQAVD